jgi:hypothetical protein
MKFTPLSFPDWLKESVKHIPKKHKNIYIPTEVAKEVYDQDVTAECGAILIVREMLRQKNISNKENCPYLTLGFKVENTFWESAPYSEATKEKFRNWLSLEVKNEKILMRHQQNIGR